MNMTLTSRLFRRAVKKDDLAIALALPGRAPLTRSQLLNLMENGGNLFITGSAGSGKSTLLREFVSKTGRKAAICAGTGLAALNVNGQTIHSLFQINPFNPDRSPNPHSFSKELFQALEVLIIDEISSVHANLFDKVDERLRWLRGNRRPFGGLRVIAMGLLQGEYAHFHMANFSFKSMAALVYLIIFGSLLGFTTYLWLLKHVGVARSSTYAFVNPMVAIFLGRSLYGYNIRR